MAQFLRFLMISLFITLPTIAADRPPTVADKLSLADAMRQGRQLLTRGESAKAVELLEQQLGRAHGDSGFLALLKEAYIAHLKELQLSNKTETYELYRKRLAIIDRPATTKVTTPPARPKEVARGVSPDDDPSQQTPISERAAGGQLLTKAEQAFSAKRYAEAMDFFKQAGRAGSTLSALQHSQYAYCLMHDVVARLNAGNTPTGALEKDVKTALALAPDNIELNKFGTQVLQEIAQRSSSTPTASPVKIKHGEAKGWKTAETLNFRLFHRKEAAYAEQFLNLAEQARTAAFAKWATPSAVAWNPICEVYLYSDGEEYAKATKQQATSPGHSSMMSPGGKVTLRRMDLRADEVNLLGSTLPHEITHIVLGNLFADMPLPRWADEGMAVLAEPRTQVDRYLKTMIRLRSEGRLIPLAQIVGQSEYPDAKAITVFYVESVSVVEFMVNLKGPAQFVAFMRDSGHGLDSALQKHYAIPNVADLQDHWLRATFTEIDREASGGR